MPTTRRPLGPTTRHVAASIRQLRTEFGMSTTTMAGRLEALGHPISQSGVTRLETGQRQITVDDLTAVATVLGVVPAALLPCTRAQEAADGACRVNGHSYDSREISGPGPRVCNDCGQIEDLED
ncbi:helix-turn-helix domain-containing protein [Streptomyces sp. NPDC091271]|uniref:helix-turn-helix domain-containing protein n=1 Tax=Streptomyces sp. NPDC091271 TaxID=3365980 RepID=UPI003804B32E